MYFKIFKATSHTLIVRCCLNEARKLLHISHTSLTGILRYWVKKAVSEMDLSATKAICVDETSFKKGQSYVTVISDVRQRKVIDVEEGRNAEAVVKFSYKLEEKGGDCNKINTFISDMSLAYEKAKEECFPKATQVIDKFHIKQEMLRAMDEVRREEQGKAISRSRQSGKKLLMIPQSKQTEQQSIKIAEISKKISQNRQSISDDTSVR